MEYIINPSWFYWLNVADSALVFLCSICVVSALCFLGSLIAREICADEYTPMESKEKIRKITRISLIAFLVSGFIAIFIPSKNTLIEMMIAKKATYDNVSWTLEQVKEAVDYVISAIKEIK